MLDRWSKLVDVRMSPTRRPEPRRWRVDATIVYTRSARASHGLEGIERGRRVEWENVAVGETISRLRLIKPGEPAA